MKNVDLFFSDINSLIYSVNNGPNLFIRCNVLFTDPLLFAVS